MLWVGSSVTRIGLDMMGRYGLPSAVPNRSLHRCASHATNHAYRATKLREGVHFVARNSHVKSTLAGNLSQ